MRLLLLLLAVPLIEIALFVQVGGALGLPGTLLIVAVTAIIGTVLLRGQGAAVLTSLRESASSGHDIAAPLAHAVLILVAGLLLLTPGFLTDTIGFALLFPTIRQQLIQFAVQLVRSQTTTIIRFAGKNRHADQVIEGVARDVQHQEKD